MNDSDISHRARALLEYEAPYRVEFTALSIGYFVLHVPEITFKMLKALKT